MLTQHILYSKVTTEHVNSKGMKTKEQQRTKRKFETAKTK